MPHARIRHATPADLDGLVALEESTFDCDRISRRQWRYHLRNPRATILVAGVDPRVDAAALVLYRKRSPTARLYSIAVAAAVRGMGVGRELLAALEAEVRARGCRAIELEVRTDNAAAIHVYEGRGYRRGARLPRFYEDAADAWRYARELQPIAAEPVHPRSARSA